MRAPTPTLKVTMQTPAPMSTPALTWRPRRRTNVSTLAPGAAAVREPAAPIVPSTPWAFPSFRFFIASMALVTLAVQMQGTIVAYQIYELTRDPLSLG